jgi:hypothetical protein
MPSRFGTNEGANERAIHFANSLRRSSSQALARRSMCLLGMNVDKPSDDFAGFAIEVKAPGSSILPIVTSPHYADRQAASKIISFTSY